MKETALAFSLGSPFSPFVNYPSRSFLRGDQESKWKLQKLFFAFCQICQTVVKYKEIL